MIYGLVNGVKIEASPKTTGTCPLCERSIFSKCGEINVWHWAHRKEESCDEWYEPETGWHKNWKLAFGKDRSEIIISQNGIKHIADILTKDNIVIELQNSPIQFPVIRSRELFYGERMLWIINGKHFRNNFLIYPVNETSIEEWYWRNEVIHTPQGYVDKNTGEIVIRSKKPLRFIWNWPRRSWEESQREIFLDFGSDTLFWVKNGMGTNRGEGIQVKKENFLEKYGGDRKLLKKLIDKHC